MEIPTFFLSEVECMIDTLPDGRIWILDTQLHAALTESMLLWNLNFPSLLRKN